jgi:hypothetical protein
MKKFKETNEKLYEISRKDKLALDMALISEAGNDMCSIPLEKLKSKVMRDRHKKMCVDPEHWSTTKKKSRDSGIQRAAKRAGMTTIKRRGLYNSLDEADLQNLAVMIQDIAQDMVDALKKNDQKKLIGLYKNLGKVIK